MSESRLSLRNRMIPRGRVAWAAIAASVILAGTSATALAIAFDDGLPADVVMRVAGDDVTEGEFAARVESLKALYGVKEPTAKAALQTFRRDAAKSMAVSLLLEREAQRRGIVVATKQAQAELAKIISQRLGGDRESFVRYLGTSGVSEQQVLDEISRTIATSRLYDEITQDVPAATKAEAKAEYDARQDQMTTPEKRRLSNIVVATEADAESVLSALAASKDFAAVAKRDSLDESTRNSGGDLGLRSADELEPAFAQAAFSAKSGAVFGPVQTQYGWNVGLVTRIVPGDALTYDQVEATLLEALTSRAQLKEWRGWLSAQLMKAHIDYAPAYEPAHPTSLPTDAAVTPSHEDTQ